MLVMTGEMMTQILHEKMKTTTTTTKKRQKLVVDLAKMAGVDHSLICTQR
jgi:hypothetical protein